MAELSKEQKGIIKGIISELSNISVDEITEETKLSDGLGLDSLDIVEMVMKFEDEFDCYIPDEDYENVKTVGDVFKIVDGRI